MVETVQPDMCSVAMIRAALSEASAAREWLNNLTLLVNCISRCGEESAPLASAAHNSMAYFSFESAGSVNDESMQNAPSASPTSVSGFQLACGAQICCISQSPSPATRNTRTQLSSKEAAMRCSPSHSNPQMQRIAV